MTKQDLKVNDILVFKNKHKSKLYASKMYIINEYYDDELNCLTNEDYNIIGLYRHNNFYPKSEFAKIKKL